MTWPLDAEQLMVVFNERKAAHRMQNPNGDCSSFCAHRCRARKEELGVRAGEGTSMGEALRLRFPALRHDALRRLTVQSSGLPVDVVRGVGVSELSALEHLELWLGASDYGADCEVADLEPILSGARLPRLRRLALRNSPRVSRWTSTRTTPSGPKKTTAPSGARSVWDQLATELDRVMSGHRPDG